MGDTAKTIAAIFVMTTMFSIIAAFAMYDKAIKLDERNDYLFKEIDGDCEKMKDYNQLIADQYNGDYNDELTEKVLNCKS